MPEHFRALIVILFLASVVFLLARRPATDLIPLSDFKRRRNLWFLLTLLAFFSHSFWLYLGAGAVILYIAGRREHNPMALFYMLLFLIPQYVREGKSQLTVAIGCTGGKHRSVTLANRLGEALKSCGNRVVIVHRDVDKGRRE